MCVCVCLCVGWQIFNQESVQCANMGTHSCWKTKMMGQDASQDEWSGQKSGNRPDQIACPHMNAVWRIVVLCLGPTLNLPSAPETLPKPIQAHPSSQISVIRASRFEHHDLFPVFYGFPWLTNRRELL